MSGKPAARVSDPTACPLPGHGTNPITAGSADVLFDGLPAARQGDPTACGSALVGNVIANVLINGKPATTLGTLGSHGNVVIGGSGTVIIGSGHTPAAFTAPTPLNIQSANWISFTISAPESYSGLSCIAHFDDGSSLSGVFDDKNQVRFMPTGKVCQRLEYGIKESAEYPSVVSDLLKYIIE
jgi:uncharacterized Zn-binding protein involved in type VI secretion